MSGNLYKEKHAMKCDKCNSDVLEVSCEDGNYLCCSNHSCQKVFPMKISPIRAGIAQIPKAKSDKVSTGLTLIPFYSLLELGKIFIEGLRYGRDNWKNGIGDREYQEERLEHALLHLIKYKEGDRSEVHLAKVSWFCFTQLELERIEELQSLQENQCFIAEPSGWDLITIIFNTPEDKRFGFVNMKLQHLCILYDLPSKVFAIDFCKEHKILPFNIS